MRLAHIEEKSWKWEDISWVTNKMDGKWYGWIPLLTKEILFEYVIHYLVNKKDITEIVDEKEKKFIDEILRKYVGKTLFVSGSDYKYYKSFKKLGDPPKEESIVLISVDDKYKIDNVLVFGDKWEFEWWVKCKIEHNGLVEMADICYQRIPGLEPDIIKKTYIIIRDIYHQHTHHESGEKDEDILLGPVLANDENEAIEKINKKFQKKIITRLRRIRDMKKEKDLGTSFEIITKAKGELTYALSFIELFKKSLPYYEYHFTYSNAIRSIEILEKDIEVHYISETNKRTLHLSNILTVLTVWIGALTVIIAIDASFGTIETLFHGKLLWTPLFVLWLIAGLSGLFVYLLIKRFC